MKLLTTFASEGFSCPVFQLHSKMVVFQADMDIDADGANGQNGQLAAYRADNTGSEHLANGGMAIQSGRVVGVTSWWKDIVFSNSSGQPLVLPNGVIPSRTAYIEPGFSSADPSAYVDSETVPYVVISPLIRQLAQGIVLGCMAIVTNTLNGHTIKAVVADIGPRSKIGEGSIALARKLGINPSPRTGGEDRPIIEYKLFPGTPAFLNNHEYTLLPA